MTRRHLPSPRIARVQAADTARIRPAGSHGIPRVSIFVETATSWGRRVVAGILAHAREHGPWHIQVEPHGPDEAPVIPPGWQGQGIIARVADAGFAADLAALGVPVVNVSSIKLPGVDFPRVMASPEALCKMAMEHFGVRGFRNFGYVGDLRQSYVQNQFEVFSGLLAGRGQVCSACDRFESPPEMVKWLRGLPKPVGVLCWGPRVGRLVIDTCLAHGIAVPFDVAVLGADYDELQSEASYPPQSGIRMASEQIGLIAAGELDRMMSGLPPERAHWQVTAGAVVAKLSSDTLAVEDPQVASAMRFIQQHFREAIGMPEVLEMLAVSRRSLERKFRDTFGMSVCDRIRQLRVNEARILLTTSDDPITLISEKAGFASYNYMDRIFHAEMGMTPRAYRAQFRATKAAKGEVRQQAACRKSPEANHHS